MDSQNTVDTWIRHIQTSRKYRGLDIPEETLRDLLERALEAQPSLNAADHTARQKLHNLMAPYLGDPDYGQARSLLEHACSEGSEEALRAACAQILGEHASTRERLPHLEEFYGRIFAVTGVPQRVLDLACGLNPLARPWMGLPPGAHYLAFDIHRPRVDLINFYFQRAGMAGAALVQDVLLNPPQEEADAAFLFKETHRMEQRQRGCSLPLWQALRVRWLLVSLPAENLTGRHDLAERQRVLVQSIVAGQNWTITEVQSGNELVFCIQKY